MHDRELFEKAFSPLHASPDTLTEVRKTMRNEKKTRRALGKGAVIAIAAALTLTIAVAGGIVTLIRADVSPADKVDDTTHHAFTDDIDAATPVVDDGKGSLSLSRIWSASPATSRPPSDWWGSICPNWTRK